MEVPGRRQEWPFSAGARQHREEPDSRMSQNKRGQTTPIWREIDNLRYQTVRQLRVKYLDVFRQESRSNHKQFLIRRIAWRLQANAEGDLSARARLRAVTVADEADLRIRPPQSFLKQLSDGDRDPRLPAVGTMLTREFKGQSISVEVLEKGFQYREQVYQSLSAVARQVTGVQWSGFAFFNLRAEPRHGS